MRAYLLRHLQTLLYSLGQLVRNPWPTLMTVAVVGIALALPTGLFVVMDNLTRASEAWDIRPQLSVYLTVGLADADVERARTHIAARREVSELKHIPPAVGLAEFRELSGFALAVDLLDENPLPAVLVVYPQVDMVDPDRMARLAAELRQLDGVEHVQVDMAWLQRLRSVIEFGHRVVLVIAVVLCVGLVLIISNTIRLAVLNRREEIQIIDLIGGTGGFIRRPFLYAGALQGVFGALFAWMLVILVLELVQGPLTRLGALYQADWGLTGLGFGRGMLLLAVGGMLGWIASRVTVGRYLRQLDPDYQRHPGTPGSMDPGI